jgi:arsenite methyltransferase
VPEMVDAKQENDLRESVRRAYSAIAARPEENPPFPTGRGLALDLGYPPELLDGLPAVAVDAFAGVSNVSLFAAFSEGVTVLDVGCGAGLDTLIVARRAGKSGRVIGVDFSEAMLRRARCAVTETGADNIELRQGAAECLPVDTESVDIVLVNGIFNLNPARNSIFRELARVVRPGGVVFAAELVLEAPLSEKDKSRSTNWFS